MKLAASLGAVALAACLPTASLAAGSGAASYTTTVAAICRANSPRFAVYEKRMTAAEKTHDAQSFGVNLGLELALVLQEDRSIYAVPVPAGARAAMSPILSKLHQADSLIRSALLAAADGDEQRFVQIFQSLERVATPINAAFDANGLRDCGSGQR